MSIRAGPPWPAQSGTYNRRPMPLSPGTRLGPYQVASPLGAGGMGEVYAARDTQARAQRRHQGAAAGVQRRRRTAGALRTRSGGDRLPLPSQHLHVARRRPAGRHDVPGDGEARRRHAGGAAGAGTDDPGGGDRLRDPDRRGPGLRASRRGRASGLEAGQRDAHEDRRQAARLRPGQGGQRRRRAPDGHGAHVPRRDSRHPALHGPRATAGRRRRCPRRHLRVWRDAPRDGHGAARVHGLEPGLAHRGDSALRAAARHAGGARRATRARPARLGVPGEGSRRSMVVGQRRAAAAEGPGRQRRRQRAGGARFPVGRMGHASRLAAGGAGSGHGHRARWTAHDSTTRTTGTQRRALDHAAAGLDVQARRGSADLARWPASGVLVDGSRRHQGPVPP